MNVFTRINRFYLLICRMIILITPLILLIPNQFKFNLYTNLVFWLILISGVLLIPLIYKSFRQGVNEKTQLFFLLYLIALGITTFFSIKFTISLAILLLQMSYFIFFTSSKILFSSQRFEGYYIKFFLGINIVLSIISLYNTLFKRYVNTASEGVSYMWIFYGHNHLAALLILAIPLCGYLIFVPSRKLLRLFFSIILFLLLFTLFWTFARGAILSLVIAAVIISFLFRKFINEIISKKLKVISVILLMVLVVFLGVLFQQKWQMGIESRIIQYDLSMRLFRTSPWIGIGPGNYKTRTQGTVYKHFVLPHNIFLQILTEGGIFLFLVWITFMLVFWLNLFKKVKNVGNNKKEQLLLFVIFIGLTGIFINEMVDFDLQVPAMGLIFWQFAGLVYSKKA